MYIYFKKFQNTNTPINWNECVGISNIPLSLSESKGLYNMYIEKEKINLKCIQTCLDFYIYKSKKKIEFDWVNDLVFDVKRICLSNMKINGLYKNTKLSEHIESLTINYCELTDFPFGSIRKRMRHLDLSFNNLSKCINLSKTYLRFIHLKNNNISNLELPYDCNTLNVSNNNLHYIELYNPAMYVNLSNNKLNDIKISKWIEDLNISNNNLNTIDISYCQKIIYLNVSNNNLSGTIDLSKNIGLKKVNVNNNNLEWIEGVELLSSLEYLDGSHNNIVTTMMPINICKTNFSNNPLELWEWIFIKETKDSMISTMGNMFFSNFVKLNKEFEEKENMTNKKIHIDLSNTNITDFIDFYSEVSNRTLINTNDRCDVHIYYYNNMYTKIPYHPKVHIHLSDVQETEWENHMSKMEMNMLKNNNFFIIDFQPK